ncbi:NAD(P)-dependent alcohol dehydrogenase [Lichenihabitans sp. Uapishka_5]|uniref:zinc-dependent alcohol dehydrogenase family protein n=1 Tax=Lichenihabitans sp. Uapishka_5 TaxID=3037302 RepID=UPI0029E81021|nr:NAD(P)-dependent alcohol dehydrogenase [Lichenihabitans sp. Uapishka_5]MDX7951484.1 NAD(P)-dependent alcohol dehydrogenase [Lichenihabitans sp. Uapishka_5]
MKQYQLVRPGSIEGLTLIEVPKPGPGPGQALIRIRATSLNYRDLMMVTGIYGGQTRAGLVPLSDGAGEVEAVGPDTSRVKPGDRVCAIFSPDWLGGAVREGLVERALGGAIDGVLSEYVVVPEGALVHMPDHLSFEEAATLPCAAVTAWHSMVDYGRVKAGDSILTQGTGGVSIFALQFAKLLGARVIGTSSSDEKLRRARELGLDEAINYRNTPDWQEAVLSSTGGLGVDHVVEVGGAGTIARSLQAVRMGGTIGVIGVLTGRAEIDPTVILRRRVGLQGISVGSREMFESMNRAIAMHGMRPIIDRVFPFEQAQEAWHYLEGATHFGKIVIRL